jgi:hypothetical protein
MKYVSPAYLLIVFGAFAVQNLPAWIRNVSNQPLAQGALGLIAAALAVILVCVRIGERRWRAAGMDLDGRAPAEDRA